MTEVSKLNSRKNRNCSKLSWKSNFQSNFAIKSSAECIVKITSGSSATFYVTRLLSPVLLNRVASLQMAMHSCARLYLKARRYSSPSGWSIINYTSHHQNSGKNKDRRRKMAVLRFQRLDPVHLFVINGTFIMFYKIVVSSRMS